MSRYAELDNAYINPSAVTHISYTDKNATAHFIGGGSLVVCKKSAEKIVNKMDDHEKIVDKMHDYDEHLEKIVYALDCKLMGRLEDIIQELATPK